MTPDEKLSLFQDISTWLDAFPSNDEIREYVRLLPDEDKYLSYEAAARQARVLANAKNEMLNRNGCLDFCACVSEHVQLNYIEYLSRYNPASVLVNLKKEYPAINFAAFPSGTTAWAARYVKRWNRAISLATCADFFKQLVPAHSVIVTLNNDQKIFDFLNTIQNILKRDSQYFDTGQLLSQSETDFDRNFFKSLGFLPDEYIDDLLKIEYEDEKLSTLTDLLSLLVLLKEYGLEKAKSNEENFKETLWMQLNLQTEWRILDNLEVERLATYDQKIKKQKDLAVYLQKIWTRANIDSGSAVEETMRYIQTMNEAQKIYFKNYFREYISIANLTGVLCGSNDPRLFVDAIYQALNVQDTSNLAEIILEDPEQEEFKDTLNKFILAVWKVLHA